MNRIISDIEDFLKSKYYGESSGHDWWHINRVRNLAVFIAKKENANIEICEIAALLHEELDHKFIGDDIIEEKEKIKTYLLKLLLSKKDIVEVINIIENVSFKGGNQKQFNGSLEWKCVQDADRIDAIGAIGIARAFSFGGYHKRELYNPENIPRKNMSLKEYKSDKGDTVNHFYEKLLLLKDRLNTKTAEDLAEQRHVFMEDFLEQFYKEWDFKDGK